MSGHSLATTGTRSSRSWLVSLVSAAVAVSAVTIAAQSIDHFHWWAGFILVPGAIVAASGRTLLARGGGGAFIGYVVACAGALVWTVGALLMFGVMSKGWPLMISLPALAIAGTYNWRPDHPLARAFHRTIASLALATVALGVTFLLLQTNVIDFGDTRWWGGFVMLAGVLVALNGLELLRHRIAYRLQAITLAFGPAVVAFLLGLRMLRDWPY